MYNIIARYILKDLFQRKFIRDISKENEATYRNFRLWLDGTTLTQEMWDSVMTEDELYDYNTTNSLQEVTTTCRIRG